VNKQIARLGVGLLACYVGLFVMVNYVQVVRADDLNDDPRNTRAAVRDFDRVRGRIISADGVDLAITLPAEPTSQFEFQRVYPTGDLFAHVTGFLSFEVGAEGAEREFTDYLSGEASEVEYQSISDLFVDREHVADVTLTVRHDVQTVARDALLATGAPRGSVVAIDPRTGAVLAMFSTPTYDPNPLSSHDLAAAREARNALLPDVGPSPLLPRAYRERFFPGSTFKVVTGSIGLDRGVVTPEQPVYPPAQEFDIDFTDDELSNFGGSTCGGALPEILRVSCNSAFAAMGAETIGEEGMTEGAARFGFNDEIPFDLPAPARSVFPTDFPDDQGNGPLARASIGQGDVAATPLMMAMVAGAIANDGVMMVPNVLDRITDERGEVLEQPEPEVFTEAVGAGAASAMRGAMIGVVERGSGTAAQIQGVEVGGKTGTAQLGTDPPSSHAWFIAFAGPPGGEAEVAVAVLIEAQPGVSEVTGGRLAAPVARQVIEAVLRAAN
jgi:peptidoglycan glycosyltransferase